MKVSMKRTKTGMTFSIRASKKGREGTDLAEVVLSILGKGQMDVSPQSVCQIIKRLGEKGYRADGPLDEKGTAVNLTMVAKELQ